MRQLFLWAACTFAVAPLALGADLDGLEWLEGGWRAQMGRVVIEEHWIPGAGGMMLGVSLSVAGDKAVGFEFLRIVSREDGVFYIAQPNGKPGTEFELTELSGKSAVFENPEHDHPKIIRYRLQEDGTLSATIEGDEGETEFLFQRIPSP